MTTNDPSTELINNEMSATTLASLPPTNTAAGGNTEALAREQEKHLALEQALASSQTSEQALAASLEAEPALAANLEASLSLESPKSKRGRRRGAQIKFLSKRDFECMLILMRLEFNLNTISTYLHLSLPWMVNAHSYLQMHGPEQTFAYYGEGWRPQYSPEEELAILKLLLNSTYNKRQLSLIFSLPLTFFTPKDRLSIADFILKCDPHNLKVRPS